MRLIDVVSAPWAITPDMFSEVQSIYTRHCRGEKLDLATIEARIGMPIKSNRPKVEVTPEGVAIIPIEGTISKRMNLMSMISGGMSSQIVSDQFAQALADPSISAIILAVDSPGGTVDGTQELSDQIYAARGKKPILAYTDGIMASAAYWIASAADAIYISGDTTMVGSIGIIGTHIDQSTAEAIQGIRVTEITAGAHKGAGSPHGALNAGFATMQARVDHQYGVFLATVARNRAVSVDTVAADMAEGRVFLGRTAIDAGLVDGVATLPAVIAMAAGVPDVTAQSMAGGAGVAQMAITTEETQVKDLTVDKVKAEAPEIAKALIDEGRATAAQSIADARAEGARAELARVAAIDALATPGHEKLIAELKADGKTTGPEAAVRIVQAEKGKRDAALANLRSDAAGAGVAAAQIETAGAGAGEKKEVKSFDPRAAAAKAAAWRAEQAALGNKVTEAEAVAHVLEGV